MGIGTDSTLLNVLPKNRLPESYKDQRYNPRLADFKHLCIAKNENRPLIHFAAKEAKAKAKAKAAEEAAEAQVFLVVMVLGLHPHLLICYQCLLTVVMGLILFWSCCSS